MQHHWLKHSDDIWKVKHSRRGRCPTTPKGRGPHSKPNRISGAPTCSNTARARALLPSSIPRSANATVWRGRAKPMQRVRETGPSNAFHRRCRSPESELQYLLQHAQDAATRRAACRTNSLLVQIIGSGLATQRLQWECKEGDVRLPRKEGCHAHLSHLPLHPDAAWRPLRPLSQLLCLQWSPQMISCPCCNVWGFLCELYLMMQCSLLAAG